MASSRDLTSNSSDVADPELLTIVYATGTGTAQKFAQALAKACHKAGIRKQVLLQQPVALLISLSR